jgi:hypothetical protein
MKRFINYMLIAGATAFASLAVASVPARADDSTSAKPLRIQVGAYFPTKDTIRDLTADTQFGGGIAYDFGSTQSIPYGLYLDFGTVKKNGYALSTVGGGVQGRYYFNPKSSKASPYFGLGIGGYNVYSDDNGSHNDFKFGGKATLGIEAQSGIYVEAGYTAIGKAKLIGENNDVDPSGATLDIGYKF